MLNKKVDVIICPYFLNFVLTAPYPSHRAKYFSYREHVEVSEN